MSRSHQHTQLKPVSASALFDDELRRKHQGKRQGHVLTGCSEIDDHVLLGGLERGSVVGISSEDEDMGLLMGFQILSRLLLADASMEEGSGFPPPRAMVVSTLSTGLLLPRLREVLAGQLMAQGCESGEEMQGRVRSCFESISIARVFDFEGLWEVVLELNAIGEAKVPRVKDPVSVSVVGAEEKTEEATLSLRVRVEQGKQGERVAEAGKTGQDDALEGGKEEKETELSSVDSSPLSSPPSSLPEVFDPDWEPRRPPREEPTQGPPHLTSHTATIESQAQFKPVNEPTQQLAASQPFPPLPDIILITHTSTLLNTLFTGRDKPTAHERTHILSAKLRQLAHSPFHGNPLILLLNSTISAPVPSETTSPEEARPGPLGNPDQVRNHTEPTLRSVFTFSPVQRRGMGPGVAVSKEMYSRPSFGLVFTQLLDLHILCSRVPQGKERNRHSGGGGLVWVIEVLLDEAGVYEIEGEGDELLVRRRNREQRWAAVGMKDEGRRVVSWT